MARWICFVMPPLTIVLSPDTEAEHDYLPEPQSLRGGLFLADRGYLSGPATAHRLAEEEELPQPESVQAILTARLDLLAPDG